jgi:O-antigen/teichoic acid export membrane protein
LGAFRGERSDDPVKAEQAMTHLGRVATEQALQALSIVLSLVDRLVLTGLLYRLWGVANFEVWSICLAVAGLVSVGEFGFNMYFANRLMAETETGELTKAQRTVWLGNCVFAVCSGVSFLVTVVGLVWIGVPHSGGMLAADTAMAVALLAGASALRLAIASVQGLYRAHREYGRLTVILVLAELARIVLTIGIALAGGGIVAAAAASLFVVVAGPVGFVLRDASTRYTLSPFGIVVPTADDVREVLAPSAAYFAQMVPLVLLTHLPVLLVTSAGTATGGVASFVLLRTLGGLPRALLQSLSALLGFECARRLALKDEAGAFQVLRSGARAFCVLSGLAAGFLFAGGRDVVAVWTGDNALYRADYMLVALAPMLAAAASVLMHNVLSASNAPYLAAVGRSLQLAITVAVALVAPITDPGLRLLVALSVGEIVGFTPLAYWAVARLIPTAGVGFHLGLLVLTGVAAVAAGGIAWVLLAGMNPAGSAGRLVALGLAGALCVPLFLGLGLTAALRAQVMGQWVAPLLGRYWPARSR